LRDFTSFTSFTDFTSFTGFTGFIHSTPPVILDTLTFSELTLSKPELHELYKLQGFH
jgi:hypothetical protein